MADGLEVELTSPLVSVPYVEMTLAVMQAFGVSSQHLTSRRRPTGRLGYAIEPDASAALLLAGRSGHHRRPYHRRRPWHVEHPGRRALRRPARADGRRRRPRGRTASPSRGTGTLHGIDVDMADISDTAQTLAAVAVFADCPTVVRGIGFIRSKETDRIAAIVTELQRAGVDATDDEDGFTIVPGPLTTGPVPHLRRPPHGDEPRPDRAALAGHRDRGPGLCRRRPTRTTSGDLAQLG